MKLMGMGGLRGTARRMMESMFTIGLDGPDEKTNAQVFGTWFHGRGQKLEVSRRSDNERRTYLFYGRKG